MDMIVKELEDADVELPDDPPPHDRIPEGVDEERVADNSNAPPPTAFDPAAYAFPNPTSIPRREWLFGRHYIRSAVGASIGAPGRLKSTTVLTEIIGMSAGRDLMSGEPLPSGPLRAAYLNGEEVQEELDRRVAAVCQRFDLKPEDCGGRLWVLSTRDKPIKVAVRSPRGDAMVQQDAVEGLKNWCDRNRIDALAIDPLISFHAVREDEVACSTLWKPPNPFDGVSAHDLKVVQRTDSQSPQWLGWWMAENLPSPECCTLHHPQHQDPPRRQATQQSRGDASQLHPQNMAEKQCFGHRDPTRRQAQPEALLCRRKTARRTSNDSN
jgi:hypothetical protein